MATVLNRTNKRLIRSVNTPDYPVAEWIINPDMSAVEGQSKKYWVITGDVVTLADQSTRDAIDAALLSTQRDGTAAQVDQVEDVLRASLLSILDELNTKSDKMNETLDAIDAASNFSQMKTNIAAINDAPQRNISQMKTVIRNKLGS